MTVQLHRLEGFYWVARHQGYARAARAFPYPITQPGVHQQVRKLEEELGAPLFERVGKDRVVLTAHGQALYAHVAPFYERLPEVEASIRTGTFRGSLKMHASGLALKSLLPPWVRRLHLKHPEIQVELSQLRTADVALLRSGEADLLIDHLLEVPDDIAVQTVGFGKTFIALPSNHPLAGRKRVRLESLADDTFIAYHADQRLRAIQLEALAMHGTRPKRTVSADSSEVILGFVAAGIGYSLVPWLDDHGPKLKGVVAIPFDVQGSRFAVHAAWRKNAPPNPFIRAALALAQS